MKTFDKKFLSCSICDSELEMIGKDMALLKTRCPNCGVTSKTMDSFYAPIESQPLPDKTIEVVYRK